MELSRRRAGGIRVSCDSLVALAHVTADGETIFAKNSDRPAYECQPLLRVGRAAHPAGGRLRCTYIEIPQVAETHAVLGSRPFWCWGFEHGLNEHGVAIGNHTVFSRDPVSGLGLIGMDLVRLGLERGASAAAAAEVITTLLGTYGQGGSGYGDKEWPYHNSFLIADGREALVLETSDRNWALRQVRDVASLSNHISVGNDWDRLSPGAISHAQSQGWVEAARSQDRFDFAAAYRDTEMAPAVISSGRHRRTCELLAQERGRVSTRGLRRALRDHYGSAAPRRDLDVTQEEFFSVCMHADPVGTTTASLIASLPAQPHRPLVYWASLGSPCVGAFIPLFLSAPLPVALAAGGAEPSNDSAWWMMKRLLEYVEVDWEGRLPTVRRAMDDLEAQLFESAARTPDQPAAQSALMQFAVAELLRTARALT